jgi:CDP-glucose 4,6-dehydratase
VEDVAIIGSFWKGKRVFLTGHTGFKGSWLALWLQSLGAKVSGYSLPPPTNPSHFEIARVAEKMSSHIGDVRDFEQLKQVFAKEQPEVVFHLAAQPLVRYSYSNPAETYATNVMGTVHLFEAVRPAPGVRALIIVTSDKCYENREWDWGYRENDPMGGYDPYSSSKGCAELVTAAYRSAFFNSATYSQHGLAVASGRSGNVIGGGDWADDRLVPDIVRAFMAGRPATVRNPHAVRPWQHVLEPLGGYLTLAEKLYGEGAVWAEGWNFGPNDDDAKSVEWIAERAREFWGNGVSWQLDQEKHPHEAHNLRLDISKARSRLKWRPKWSLERALQSTLKWYRAYQLNFDMREQAILQIAEYDQTEFPN